MANRISPSRVALRCLMLTLPIMTFAVGVRAQDNGESSAPTVTSEEAAAKELPAINGFAETWRSAPSAKKARGSGRKVDDLGRIHEIEMFVGETRIFSAPKVARIAVGNGQIMSAASLDEKEVIVFANAAGTSSLFIWNRDGRYRRVKINIVPGDTSRLGREIAAFLSNIPKAKASVIGDKVVVEGDDLDDQDLNKIEALAKRYPQIVNFTNPIGWDQMVLMDVKVVEFPRNELRELGLKWGATGGTAIGGVWSPISYGKSNGEYQVNLVTGSGNAAPITAQSSSGGSGGLPLHTGPNILSVLNMGLNAQLNLMAEDGNAAILASPQLSARNGATAEFLAGGELPYTVSSINGTTVLFKPYGIKLEITPRVGKNGVIRAKINSEVSSIDPSISTASGPALLSRNTKTEFNLLSGDTLVLAGLISRKNSNDITKIPLLGDIPVLGALFRSKRFQNDETELVVFVTPTVVDAQSPGLVDRVERTKQRLEKQMGPQPYLTNPLQPGRDSAQPNGPAIPVVVPPEPEPVRPPARNPEFEFLGGVLEHPDTQPAPTSDAGTATAPPTAEQSTTPRRAEAPTLGFNPLTARPSQNEGDNKSYRVTGRRLALRVSPDVNAHILDRMPLGAEVQSLSERRQGDWLAVEYRQQWGWAAIEYLAPADSIEEAQ